jgi:hypothetical protein
MGILSKIFGREQTSDGRATPATTVACPHTILLPHWDSLADMGKEDLATTFTCQSCSETFTPEQAKELRATTAERLQGV